MNRKRTSILLNITFLIIIASSTAQFSAGQSSEFSVDRANRVNRMIEMIRKNYDKNRILQNRKMREITFHEDELNSYLNVHYTRKYAPMVKYIKLNFASNSRVSGDMKVLFEGEKYSKIPGFLKKINIEFNGKLENKNFRMRFDFKEIQVNGVNFSPEMIDDLLVQAQGGMEVKKSIFDWFNLFPGIRKVITDHKKVTIFY